MGEVIKYERWVTEILTQKGNSLSVLSIDLVEFIVGNLAACGFTKHYKYFRPWTNEDKIGHISKLLSVCQVTYTLYKH